MLYVALKNNDDVKVLNLLCDAGYYTSTGNAEYDQNEGKMSCTACGMGEYGTVTGATECTKCAAGTYNPTEATVGIENCLICTAGSYCTEGTGQPLPCPAGTYSATVGGTAADICVDCPVGHECPSAAILEPIMCGVGYYSDQVGAVSCTQCSNGRLSLPGSDEAEDCVNPVPNFLIAMSTEACRKSYSKRIHRDCGDV